MRGNRLLVGTRNKFLLWDGQPHVIREHRYRWAHCYYGITWSEDTIYVAEQLRHRWGAIHVYSGDLVHQERMEMEELKTPHQILWWGGLLWMANAIPGQVLVWDGVGVKVLRWQREDGFPLHPNSIWCDGELVYVLEHRGPKMPKWVRVLDMDFETVRSIKITGRMFKRKRGVHGVHNVYVENGMLYMLSPSGVMRLEMESGKSDFTVLNRVGSEEYYVRGLARTDRFYIGLSEIREREERAEGGSFILVTDDDFNVTEMIRLEGTGALHEIRVVDGVDRAHNRIPCPYQ